MAATNESADTLERSGYEALARGDLDEGARLLAAALDHPDLGRPDAAERRAAVERRLARARAAAVPIGSEGELEAFERGGAAALPRAEPVVAAAAAPPDAWRRVLEAARVLAAEDELTRILTVVLDVAVELSGAERAFLVLEGGEGDDVEVAAARSIDREAVRKPEMKLSRTIARAAIAAGRPVVTRSAVVDPRFGAAQSVRALGLHSIVALPLRGATRGALYLDHRFLDGAFAAADLALLQALADHAAVAIERSRLSARARAHQADLERANTELEGAKRELEATAARLAEQNRGLTDEVERARLAVKETALRHRYEEIAGRSPKLADALRLLDRATDSALAVLVVGESGTGKELVARALHTNGPRSSGPFVAVNCAAVTETLLEAELFGHVRGAFTGADRDRPGLFEVANGGTLFLDEVGDMSPALQPRLLRVLETGEMRRVGATDIRKVDVRIVAATNRDLRQLVEEGQFRRDLYYRLAVVTIALPSLRERREDIPLLIQRFLPEGRKLAPATLRALLDYDWPGNIRQLENEVRRLIALAPAGGEIGPEHLSEEVAQNLRVVAPRPPSGGVAVAAAGADAGLVATRGRTFRDIEVEVYRFALRECGGKRADAAKRLGIPRSTFYDRLRALGIEGD